VICNKDNSDTVSAQMSQTVAYGGTDPFLELTKPIPNKPLILQLTVVESGGEDRVEVDLYYGHDSGEGATKGQGVAYGLAQAAGTPKSYLPASAVPPECSCEHTASPTAQTAAELLHEMGVAQPHGYYRSFAYVAAILTFMISTFCFLLKDFSRTYMVDMQDAYMVGNYYLSSYWSWWCTVCQSPPPFQDPNTARTRSRTRKQGQDHWTCRLHVRRLRRKPLTASLKRRCRRYRQAVQEHDTAAGKAAAAQTITYVSKRVGSRVLLPFFLLMVVCLVATTVATPNILEGHRVFTSSLAAWELSHLAGWRFR
jgi:hypothetical protein